MFSFCKFHGFGNDYIVFDQHDLRSVSSVNDFAERVCQRHTGVGADGIAIIEKLDGAAADYSCRIINPDGSEAAFSGNGTRCAVAYLYYKNLWQAKSLKLETKSGVKTYELLEQADSTYWFLAELGKPRFDLPGGMFAGAPTEDLSGNPVKRNLLVPHLGIIVKDFFFVGVGNPVACVFVEDFDVYDWRQFGEQIENLRLVFPERTNVVFIKTIDRDNIEIRIWERGAGETASSGTCSIAAAVASASTGKTNRQVAVHAPGGTTEAVWREDDEMMITGRADLVFCGEYFESID